jgi:hypothetical protein
MKLAELLPPIVIILKCGDCGLFERFGDSPKGKCWNDEATVEANRRAPYCFETGCTCESCPVTKRINNVNPAPRGIR